MELMPMNLTQLLHSDLYKLTFADIQHIMFQICQALNHLHLNGFMHRDVKPSNMMLHSDGRVILSDLDLMCPIDQKEKSLITATRWYKCPEMCYGDKNYTEARDIWALGCLFGELLTKKIIFECDRESDIYLLDKFVTVLGDANVSLKFRHQIFTSPF